MTAYDVSLVESAPQVTLPVPVVHLVCAMTGAADELWGKERVITALMRAQLAGGEVLPRLITFAPCRLADMLSTEGFTVQTLEEQHRWPSLLAALALRRSLTGAASVILHTHGYKANVIGRVVRATGAPMRGLVSTCHGWIDETPRTRLYNSVDRATAFMSDVVTVTDEGMLQRFPRGMHARYVANGVEDREPPAPSMRSAARAHFGLLDSRFHVGILGRADTAKGVMDVLEAARRAASLPIQWIIAGSGPLEDEIRNAGLANVTLLGYVKESALYLESLDVYLQASHTEGLSLSLLEAMRARLPIVATRAGSTAGVARHMQEALIVPPRNVDQMIAAVRALMNEPDFALHLACAARRRFESAFQVEHQHQAFLNLYRRCDRATV